MYNQNGVCFVMQAMMDFALWFLEQLPDFLMSEPISAFVGMFFLYVVIDLIGRLIKLN